MSKYAALVAELTNAAGGGSWPRDLPTRAAAALTELERWQPIETAPKDGTPLLGFMPSYYQGKGGQSVILWLRDNWMDNRAFVTKPTHWQPLPAPPDAAIGGKGYD